MKTIFLAVITALMFTGCASVMQQAGNDYLIATGHNDDSTGFCYDYWDKVDCPKGLIQVDLDVFKVIPGTSRFCFGILDTNATTPDGMICVKHNFIPDTE